MILKKKQAFINTTYRYFDTRNKKIDILPHSIALLNATDIPYETQYTHESLSVQLSKMSIATTSYTHYAPPHLTFITS